jgi:hypothetical protein
MRFEGITSPIIPDAQVERVTWVRSDFHVLVAEIAGTMDLPRERAERMRIVRDELQALMARVLAKSDNAMEAEAARFDPERVFPTSERKECPFFVES